MIMKFFVAHSTGKSRVLCFAAGKLPSRNETRIIMRAKPDFQQEIVPSSQADQ